MFCIDGLFLSQTVTGIQRVAEQMVRQLDELSMPGEFQIAVPADAVVPPYTNLEVVRIKGKGMLWEQCAFPLYLRRHHLRPLCLCNVLPILQPKGIVYIHDVSYKANPQFFTGFRQKLSAMWHCLQYRLADKKALAIITVSEFSRQELVRFYPDTAGRVTVIYHGWQHILQVKPAENVLSAFPMLRPHGYVLMIATLAENKNFSWIWRQAKKNPDVQYALIGKGNFAAYMESHHMDQTPNLIFLGYLDDAACRGLIENCRYFVFPTFYEGFGLPPLEAMACGASVYVSDTPCMHEIMGDGAAYIDPKSSDPLPPPAPKSAMKKNLARFSWEKAGQELIAELRSHRAE